MSSKTKVLIVDDSRIFRSIVEESLADEEDIEVIGSVRNGIKALEFIQSTRPDLVTLDVEMPDMNGLETLKAIEAINQSHDDLPPIGVIMLSAFTRQGAEITIEALEAGAFDFITKPETEKLENSLGLLSRKLKAKIRLFTSQHPDSATKSRFVVSKSPFLNISRAPRSTHIQAILIGTSTGGPKALVTILPVLCQKVDLPIFIVQHMPSTFTESLANSLDRICSHTVIEVTETTPVQTHHVYIAPGGGHMLIRRQENKIVIITNQQPPEKGCRPSVDVLFRSAAPVFGGNVVAIILTGMGDDGVKGIGTLKRAGAEIIAQDESSSVVWGMPGSAIESGHVDIVLPLLKIPEAVARIVYGETQ